MSHYTFKDFKPYTNRETMIKTYQRFWGLCELVVNRCEHISGGHRLSVMVLVRDVSDTAVTASWCWCTEQSVKSVSSLYWSIAVSSNCYWCQQWDSTLIILPSSTWKYLNKCCYDTHRVFHLLPGVHEGGAAVHLHAWSGVTYLLNKPSTFVFMSCKQTPH